MIQDLQLPGYETGPVLFRYADRVVIYARRISDGSAVAIETLDSHYPSRHQAAAIRREGLMAQRLTDLPGIRRVHEILNHGSGNLALICDLYRYSLRTLLESEQGANLSIEQAIDIALKVTRILGDLHQQEIIHKAITPDHILYDPGTDRLAISGFAIASELDQEHQAVHPSRSLEAPLAYMSPEQTGRMNRNLDYRTDYYSLGVVLYELLTGRLPFHAENILQWVHAHISQPATSPRSFNADLPEVLTAVVLKLLEKCPEQRYQSSAGLAYDLQVCATALSKAEPIPSFTPGTRDLALKFLLPQNLYGRQRELEQLFSLFEDAVAGANEFCLVHGHSGVGKSALVNEIDRPLVRERGFLVQGKFDQFQQGESYAVLASTFRSLTQQILAESDERLSQWRERLTEALQPNAQLVIDRVPELELIIGPQPQVADLPPAEARNRMQIVLSAFLKVFAGEGHPVVLFLDDLQWSDQPTLELLRRMTTSREITHLLLIGAYRSNEISPGHPLRLLLDDLQRQKPVRQIPLGLLDPVSVNSLVADALRRQPEQVHLLSDRLYEKAQGNPFFTTELLRHLYKDGAISADPESGSWHWDLNLLRWDEVSTDIIAFMLDNLRTLPLKTQQVLQRAACIGNSFDLLTLATVNQASIAETAAALMPALKQHTLRPLDNDYRLINVADKSCSFSPRYRFQHDRVQQAAYALINPEQLSQLHLSIGRLMLKSSPDPVPNERLIEIVGHLNQGYPFLQSQTEKLELAVLNLRAGKRAREASAYQPALDYLRLALNLLPHAPWESSSELMRDLAAEIQQCSYLTGDTAAAEEWFGQMLLNARSDLERADILAIRTRQYATLGRMEDSILSAIKGLTLLGIEFTDQPDQADIQREQQRVIEYLGQRRIADLVDAPAVQDPATLTAMRLLMEIFAAAFLSASGKLFPYLVLKSVNLSLQKGNSPEAAFSYAAYGMLLCGELDRPAEGFEYARVGLEINQKLDDLTLRARVIYVYAMFVHHWSRHWSSLTPMFRKGIEAGYQSGDLLYLAYSAQDCVIWDPTLDLETAHQLHTENLEIVRDCAYQDSLDSGTLFRQLQRNLLGLTISPFSLNDDSFDEQQCLEGMRQRQFMTGIANYHIYSAEICLLYTDYERALMHVREQDNLIKSAMSLPQLTRFYIVAFLTLATHYPTLSSDEQHKTRQRLQRDLQQMQRWASNCKENFLHLQLLMEAELLRLDDQHEAAMVRYDEAIDAAQASSFLRDEAMTCERTARYLLSRNRKRSAEGYLRAAHRLYERWGAKRKIEMLAKEFPELRQRDRSEQYPDQSTLLSHFDLASVMKASREISGEIVLDRLLQTSMQILLENAGGQLGCLLVRHGEGWQLAAAEMAENQRPVDGLPQHSLVTAKEGSQLPIPISLISEVQHTGQAVILDDASNAGQFIRDPYILTFNPISVFCMPIRREHFQAVLYMENNLSSAVFTEERVEIIRLLAAQASVAIENARLYEQVQDYSHTLEEKVAERTAKLEQLNRDLQGLVDRDGLTGAANRRRSDTYLEQVWGRLRREQQPLSLLMLDVDHFKTYNDNYGHQAGDDCLIAVANALKAQLQRPADLVARYGGEEFLLILPNTDATGSAIVAEKVRKAVESLGIPHQHSSAGTVVSVSIGIASQVPDQESSAEQLLREADRALYEAKKTGRNRVVCSGNRL